MIEEDARSLHQLSYLYETSYYCVEIFEQGTQLWKSYTIKDKTYIEKIMPYVFSWNLHVCMQCNQLQLLFPYRTNTTMKEVYKHVESFNKGIDLLQHLFLTLQHEQLENDISYMLCDQKNLVLDEDNQWNLYGSPRLEVLLRESKQEVCCWQKLCANLLQKMKEQHYANLPVPALFETILDQLQAQEVVETHQILTMLGQLKGCYQGVLPPLKRYKIILHYACIVLLVLMIILSILFFAYEYNKAHQEYFNDIEKIGDVLVNHEE